MATVDLGRVVGKLTKHTGSITTLEQAYTLYNNGDYIGVTLLLNKTESNGGTSYFLTPCVNYDDQGTYTYYLTYLDRTGTNQVISTFPSDTINYTYWTQDA